MKGTILTNSSSIDRSKTDFYPTPPEVTIALMEYMKLDPCRVWECACGQGHMSKILSGSGHKVTSTDLYDDSYGIGGIDFITNVIDIPEHDWIITNPPFKQSIAFIKRAYKLGKPFAFLLKSQYWHAENKTMLFRSCRPSKILALNWRPDFHFGKKGGSPTMECLWVIWEPDVKETIYDVLLKPGRELKSID